MDLKKVCGDIKKRDIVLYGDQDEIELFLDTYYDLLNIHTVITEFKEEYILQPYIRWNIKVELFDEIKLSEEQLVVICSSYRFGLLKRYLDYSGKKEYKDYISQELVEHLVYHKKLMVCMGTQLMQQVCLFLKRHQKLIEQYSIIYYPEDGLMEAYCNRLVEYVHACRCCDVYIRSSCEKERFPLKIPGRKVLNEDCKIITVADYCFGGYYPQIIKDRNRVNDYLMRERIRLDMDYETLAFSRTDKEILKLCQKQTSVNNIVEILMDVNFYSQETVNKYFSHELELFRQQERTADIKLSDFIYNQKQKYLCCNLNEWTEPVISYISNAVVKMLNVPPMYIDEEEGKKLLEESIGSELPIYPSVQKALGLEEMVGNKKYKVVTYTKIEYMELEKYLNFITNYLYKAIDIMEFTGMNERLKGN